MTSITPTPARIQTPQPAAAPTLLGTRHILSVDRSTERGGYNSFSLGAAGFGIAAGGMFAAMFGPGEPKRTAIIVGSSCVAAGIAASGIAQFISHRFHGDSYDTAQVFADHLAGPQEALAAARQLHQPVNIVANPDGSYAVLYDHGKLVADWGVAANGQVERIQINDEDRSEISGWVPSTEADLFSALPRDPNAHPGTSLSARVLHLGATPPDGVAADLALAGKEYNLTLTGAPVPSVADGIAQAKAKVEEDGTSAYAIDTTVGGALRLDPLQLQSAVDPRGASAADAYNPTILAAVTPDGIYQPAAGNVSQPQPGN